MVKFYAFVLLLCVAGLSAGLLASLPAVRGALDLARRRTGARWILLAVAVLWCALAIWDALDAMQFARIAGRSEVAAGPDVRGVAYIFLIRLPCWLGAMFPSFVVLISLAVATVWRPRAADAVVDEQAEPGFIWRVVRHDPLTTLGSVIFLFAWIVRLIVIPLQIKPL